MTFEFQASKDTATAIALALSTMSDESMTFSWAIHVPSHVVSSRKQTSCL
jgi:hypothetical protein